MSKDSSSSAGSVVWFKYGKNFWPAEITEEYPEEMTARRRKPPLLVVKFFDEDCFEAVTNEAQYKPYNIENKNDLIKKGLQAIKKPEILEKFKKDVLRAEGLDDSEKVNFFEKVTKEKAGGNGNKINYKEIFTEKKPQPAPAPPPPTPKVKATATALSTPKAKAATPAAKKLKKGRQSSAPDDGKKYKCEHDQCTFTTDRLNLITMHAKSHSSVTPASQIPKPMSPATLSPSKTYVHSDTPISKRVGTGRARFSTVTATTSKATTLKASQPEPSKVVSSLTTTTTIASASPAQPKKRGRKSKETLRLEKELEEKAKVKKEDILAEWSGDEAETTAEEEKKNVDHLDLDEEDEEEIESEEPKEKRPKQKNFDDIFNKLLFAKHGPSAVGETSSESQNDEKMDISEPEPKNTIEEEEKIVSDVDVDADKVEEKEKDEEKEKEKEEQKEDDLMSQIDELLTKDSTLDKINKSLEIRVSTSNSKPIIIPANILNNSISDDDDDDDQEMEEILEKIEADKEKEKVIEENTNERELNTPSPTKSSTELLVPTQSQSQLITAPSLKSSTINEAPVLAVKSLPQQVEQTNISTSTSTPKTYKIIKPITSTATPAPTTTFPAPITIPPSSQPQPTKNIQIQTPATAATASSLLGQQKQKQIGVVRPNSTSPVHASNTNIQQFTSANQINDDLKKPIIQQPIVTTTIPPNANLQQIIATMQQQQNQNQLQTSSIITNPSPMRNLAKSGGLTPAEQIVHLVPIENADGTVTYMLLSLNQEGLLMAETEGNQAIINSAASIESNQQGIPVRNLENLSSIYVDTKEGTDVDTLIRQIEAGRACSTTTNPNNQMQQNVTNTTGLMNQNQQQQQFSVTLDNSNINQQQQQQQQQTNQELVIQLAEDGSLISDQLFDIDSLQIFNPE